MRFLNKLINFLKNNYYGCPVCRGMKNLIATRESDDLPFNHCFRNCAVDSRGKIHINCPECNGTGIMFE